MDVLTDQYGRFDAATGAITPSDYPPEGFPANATAQPPDSWKDHTADLCDLVSTLDCASATSAAHPCYGFGATTTACSAVCSNLTQAFVTYGISCSAAPRFQCFPASAQLTTPVGAKPISEVHPGELVLVARRDGTLGFEPVSLVHSHGPAAIGHYLVFSLANGYTLRISHRHYVPVGGRESLYKDSKPTLAQDISVGDYLWVAMPGSNELQSWAVKQIHDVTEAGAYNVHTASHGIVVGGTVAHEFTEAFPFKSVAIYQASCEFSSLGPDENNAY